MENGIQIEELKNALKAYVSYIKRYGKLFLLIGCIGLILGVYYAYRYKPYYVSNLSFIINDAKSSGGGGALSALAGQLGLGSSSPNITDDRILYLARTKRILGNALLKKLSNEDITFADKLAVVLRLKDAWAGDTTLAKIDKFKAKNIDELSYAENMGIDVILNTLLLSNRLNFETVSRKSTSFVGVQSTGIISITFESRNEKVSIEFVNAIYNELTEFYVGTMLKNLQYNYDLISFKTDSIKELLSQTEVKSAEANDAIFNVFKNKAKVSEQRLRRDVELLNAMYIEGVKNKEIARFNLEQERPVFQLVETPKAPLEKKDKSMVVFGVVGFFVFLFMGLGFTTLLFIIQVLKGKISINA